MILAAVLVASNALARKHPILRIVEDESPAAGLSTFVVVDFPVFGLACVVSDVLDIHGLFPPFLLLAQN